MSRFAPYIAVMRPQQWLKNLLIPAPAFFAGTLLTPEVAIPVLVAVAAFSLTASAVYAINDIADRADDARHPAKRRRPVASGTLSLRAAGFFALVLLASGSLLARFVPGLSALLLAYVALNLLYSRFLKHVAVVDIAVVAFFYVARLVAGSIAAGVTLSPWITLATFFLALFLVCGKRYGEFSRMDGRRAVLRGYSREALMGMLAASAALSIASYGLWTVLAHPSPLAVYTVIPVCAVIFRSLNRICGDPTGAEVPELSTLEDPWTLWLTASWALSMGALFYLA